MLHKLGSYSMIRFHQDLRFLCSRFWNENDPHCWIIIKLLVCFSIWGNDEHQQSWCGCCNNYWIYIEKYYVLCCQIRDRDRISMFLRFQKVSLLIFSGHRAFSRLVFPLLYMACLKVQKQNFLLVWISSSLLLFNADQIYGGEDITVVFQYILPTKLSFPAAPPELLTIPCADYVC